MYEPLNEITNIQSLILIVIGVSVFLIVIFSKKFVKSRKPKPVRKEKKYTFEEASKDTDTLFRCPNPECRAYFSEPAIVDNYMTSGIDSSKRYYVQGASKRSYACPKCGAPLNMKVK
jgi:hypothetical protein